MVWDRLFTGPVYWQSILLAVLPTLLSAGLAAIVARRLATALLRSVVGGSLEPDSPVVRGPARLAMIVTFVAVSAVLIVPAFELVGLRPRIGDGAREVASWLFGPGVRIALIALVAYLVARAAALLVRRFEVALNQSEADRPLERANRARTLGSIFNKVGAVLIIGTAGLLILNEVGVDIGPLLTGAGIAGLAIGIGAQTLVRDVLSGFFLILEDQVRVGDDATINGTDGTVEEINLRTIVLRDVRGTVHVFANGNINTLANHSKDYSRYVIDLDIAYDEDPDRVADIARGVDRELRSDPAFESSILQPVEIPGVVAFTEWSMQLRIQMKTVPQRQFVVGREFRKRLRKALHQHGIEVPYPAFRSVR